MHIHGAARTMNRPKPPDKPARSGRHRSV